MATKVHIELVPMGKKFEVEPGSQLQDVLFAFGVEFPCGGRGRCKGCRVKVLDGEFPITAEQSRVLSPEELQAGWRLACRGEVRGPLKIELAQWEASILADDSAFTFIPQAGLGVAVDLGTTTVVAQLLDLQTGNVLAVRSAWNTQARHGGDIMSRVDYAVSGGGQADLTTLIRNQIGALISELFEGAGRSSAELQRVVVVGNTVMHHFFCGLDAGPLSQHPFEPDQDGLHEFSAREVGWELGDNVRVLFLPCLGGFVGSDILAGIVATRLHESEALCALIDLGTNGEIVIGNRDGMLCSSTAAGPAFEGARISMGMRAATGAISEVTLVAGRLHCRVLGHAEPRGLCGSGLVDAVAGSLDAGWIKPSGRITSGDGIPLQGPVKLNQADIRELQLAKGAIAAGIRLMVEQMGRRLDEVQTVHLAGAFGNYINRASAQRIGLLPFPIERVKPAGNTALLGAKLALFAPDQEHFQYRALRAKVRHTCLNEDERFQEVYVEEMSFPPA
ncbi:MAG: ASKHA domain-containing protein [Verrucomicrobiota bacterium]